MVLRMRTASGCRLQFGRRGNPLPSRSSVRALTADPVCTDTPWQGLPAAAAKNRPIVAVFGTMGNGDTHSHYFSSTFMDATLISMPTSYRITRKIKTFRVWLKPLNCKRFFSTRVGISRRKAEDDKFEDKKTNLSHFQSGLQTGFSLKYIFIFISICCKEEKRRINLAPYLLGDSLHLFIIRKESH